MSTSARRSILAAAAALLTGAALLTAPATPALAATGAFQLKVVAGTGTNGSTLGMSALTTQLNNPTDVAFDPAGNMYISDGTNCQVKMVAPDGTLSVKAGSGVCDPGFLIPMQSGPAASFQFGVLSGIAYNAGNLYVSDETRRVIYKIDQANNVSIYAGWQSLIVPGSTLTNGPALGQRLGAPRHLTVVGNDLYFVAASTWQFAKIDLTTNQLTVVAGNGGTGEATVGGAATGTTFLQPEGITADSAGNTYVSDVDVNKTYKIDSNGNLALLQDGLSYEALVFGADGELYGAGPGGYFDRISTTVVGHDFLGGTGELLTAAVDGPLMGSDLALPYGLDIGTDDALYLVLKNSGQVVRLATAVPAKPAAPTVTAGAGTATVTWTAPADNGTPAITSYTVQAYSNGVAVPGADCSSLPLALLTCAISGLVNGTAYTFEVTATNSEGDSLPSAGSAGTPADKPDPPAVTSLVPGAAKVTVTWSAPATNGAVITDYTVRAYDQDDALLNPANGCTAAKVLGVPALQCDVTGLANATEYKFDVTATNSAGTSNASVLSSMAMPVDAPEAPAVTAAIPGAAKVLVKWSMPVDNGSSVTGYDVQAYAGAVLQAGKTCSLTGVTKATSLECEVTGLTNGTEYTFQVTATNDEGTGPAGTSPPATPVDKPQAPVLTLATRGAAKVSVTWTPPVDNGGSMITSYTVQAYAAGVAVPGKTCTTNYIPGFPGVPASPPIIMLPIPATPATPPATQCDVTGLTNGTPYTFKVVAANAQGTGPASNESSAATPADKPAAPTVTSAAPGAAKVTVTWDAPNDNGSPITAYEVQAYDGGSLVSGKVCAPLDPTLLTGLTCDVTGLTNGTTYTFRVTASNLVGPGAFGLSQLVIPADRPQAPTVAEVVPGPSEVTVKWIAPVDFGGSAITSYKVQAYDGVTPLSGRTCSLLEVDALTDLECTIESLSNGTEYTFTVIATNVLGDSVDSLSSSVAIPVDKPQAPTVTGAEPGAGKVLVKWTAPVDFGGSAITGYKVQAFDGATPVSGGTCAATAPTLECEVSGLTNGTAYTFEVTATNDVGDSVKAGVSAVAVPVDKPDAPMVTAVEPGAGKVLVKWTAPVDFGGSAITGYKVQAFDGATPVSGGTCAATAPTLECEVSGLTNGTAYTFEVTATNDVGDSVKAGVSAVAVPVDKPQAPTVTAVEPGAGKVLVKWTAPVDFGGSAITGYKVQAYAGVTAVPGATCDVPVLPFVPVLPILLPVLLPAAGLECAIDGLTNGTPYTFEVTATNDVGDSVKAGVSAVAIPVDKPQAPTVTATVPGAGKVLVKWTAPVDFGGSVITGYKVQAYDGETPVSGGTCTATGAALECEVTGLSNGTPYTFEVTATNDVGDSLKTGVSEVTVPIDIPEAPTVTAVVAGPATVTVKWSEPVVGGGTAITGYEAQAYENGSPTGKICTLTNLITNPALECAVTGLTNGTAYTFKVRAMNKAGDGALSDPSDPATPVDKPKAPAVTSAAAGTNSASLTWTAPTDTGGRPVTSYQVQVYQAGVAVNNATCAISAPFASPLTCSVAGLTNGTAYTLRVVAANSVGTGPESADSSPVTPTVPVPPVPNAPDAPGTPTASAGVSSITVSWPAASGVVTGYTAYASPGSASCSTSSASDRSCVIGAIAGTSYTVTVVARGPGGASAASAASNAVTPTAPVEPTTVPTDVPVTLTTDKGQLSIATPAQTITVIGTGFAPFSTAKVTIYSDPIVLGTVTTDANGSFSVPVTIPASLEAGSHTFLASGVDPQGQTRQMALPVTVAPASSDSSGANDENQTTTLPVPKGGGITLLDSDGNPASTVTVPKQGTYAVDATTGIITFVPVTGFVGKATPVTYRITDSIGTMITGTYTAVVTEFSAPNPGGPEPSTGSVKVVVPKLVVTSGQPKSATMTATATFTAAVKGRSTVKLWSTVSGKRVVLGTGTIKTTTAGKRVAVRVVLNPLGRALTARPGGYVVAVSITTVPDSGKTLRASSRTNLVLSSFTAPRAVYFATASGSVSKAQTKYLTTMRAKLHGVKSVTCVGHTDDRGNKAASLALGRKRAKAVCSVLAARLHFRTVIVTKGDANPSATNKTKAGMARNRRADIIVNYR
ncbi:hypothetical protein GCM10010435_90450 [Winogradskya consettensis]|uniref:Fibronectin type III domain protein n=1 Tax=Winogradskya consettensis TaxID=113560 RepID=A0A919W6S3_9ACTN|nr:fibronectin type III domain-containing protein [Actinoplanes consettensis]GIM84380.1 hypothetical protein Aco04nite_91140 [Actinoplanes consettensis]